MMNGKLLIFRTQIKIFSLFVVFLFNIECLANKGTLGVSVDAGYANLPTRDLHSPTSTHGMMGRLRTFAGITNAIGVELSLSNAVFSGYTPILLDGATVGTENPQTISLTPIERIQIRQMSFGVVYVIDVYRIIPYFSVGLSKMYTGARNVRQGASVDDVAAYVDAAVDYQISRNVRAGLVGTFHFPFTSHSDYGGHWGVLLRLSYVWHTQKLNLPQKNVE